ncbi:hypothetical protein [Bartonella acomydis]|uniref:hypothetical protein n=1 Tax=Bartonella acomydis TaxID=686234 RepID=UPI0031E5AAD3
MHDVIGFFALKYQVSGRAVRCSLLKEWFIKVLSVAMGLQGRDNNLIGIFSGFD